LAAELSRAKEVVKAAQGDRDALQEQLREVSEALDQSVESSAQAEKERVQIELELSSARESSSRAKQALVDARTKLTASATRIVKLDQELATA